MSPLRFCDAAGPMAPRDSPSGDMDLPSTKGLSERASCDGEGSEYAIPIPPAEAPADGPDNVVDAFRPDDATAVVPHPRYPDEPSSLISYAPSFPAEPAAVAAAGSVGSLLGL